MLFGEFLNTVEKLREPASNSSTVYAKLHWATRELEWVRSVCHTGQVIFFAFWDFLILCLLYAMSIPNCILIWKSFNVSKEKLNSPLSFQELYQEICFAAYRGLYTLQKEREKLFHRKAEL